MNSQWTLTLVIQYGLIALGFIGFLLLWITAKIEIRTVQSALANSRISADTEIRSLSAGIEELRGLQKVEPAPPFPAGAQSLNLTKRAQALRMHRRGETIASIAAALEAPSNEVELLLKLDSIIESRPQ
jgi:hypothetical protein